MLGYADVMWKNKHIILALLIAPVLAIIAWFSVDYFVAEQPHAARPGASYPLVARPNCRRLSDGCELVNEDFRLTLAVTQFDAGGAEIDLTSEFALDQAAVGVANAGGGDSTPTVLLETDAEGKRWRGRAAGALDAQSMLRVAVTADDSTFYAEVPVTFFFVDAAGNAVD